MKPSSRAAQIPESKLPQDSIILGKPVSYYQKYKYHLWGAFSIFVLGNKTYEKI